MDVDRSDDSAFNIDVVRSLWINVVLILMGLTVVSVLLPILTVIYLLVKKSWKEIPLFVALQMLCLCAYGVCSAVYFTKMRSELKEEKTETHELPYQSFLDNALNSFADLCLLLHEWIFTE